MSEAQLQALLVEAEQLQDSPTKVAILEQAVLLADASGDLVKSYQVRDALISTAVFSGNEDLAIVAFTWCLGQSDRDRERFPESNLLWQYKWMLANVVNFPQISLRQIHAMEDDFEVRLRRNGYSLRPVHRLRWSNAEDVGDEDAAQRHFTLWEKSRRDSMADCRACELNHRVSRLIGLGDYAQAVKAASPLLKGQFSCTTVPITTFASLLRPLMHLGDWEQAAEMYKRGYRKVLGNSNYTYSQARYLQYLTRLNEFAKGVKLLERHLPWVYETRVTDDRMHFFAHTANFLEKYATKKPRKLKMVIPSKAACFDEAGTYDPAELAAWFGQEAEVLAEKFNTRNGNRFVSEDLADQRQLTLEAT